MKGRRLELSSRILDPKLNLVAEGVNMLLHRGHAQIRRERRTVLRRCTGRRNRRRRNKRGSWRTLLSRLFGFALDGSQVLLYGGKFTGLNVTERNVPHIARVHIDCVNLHAGRVGIHALNYIANADRPDVSGVLEISRGKNIAGYFVEDLSGS